MDKYTQIGQLGKSYGDKGYVRVKLFDNSDGVMEADFVFLPYDDYHVPFRILDWLHKPLRVLFDDITTQNQADSLATKGIYLESTKIKEEHSGILEFIGYAIWDEDILVGEIEAIQELPNQLLATVAYEDRKVMIPIHEELINEMNIDDKKIIMSLPEGLLDL